MSSESEYYELYGEYIALKDLGIASLISTAIAMLLFSIAPTIASLMNLRTSGIDITLGAIGATIGFAISTFMIKVKREVREV
jgi:hypothetical protein